MMYDSNHGIQIELDKIHRANLMRWAAKEQLAHSIKVPSYSTKRKHRLAIAQLGKLIAAVGVFLQNRYGEVVQPALPVASVDCVQAS